MDVGRPEPREADWDLWFVFTRCDAKQKAVEAPTQGNAGEKNPLKK